MQLGHKRGFGLPGLVTHHVQTGLVWNGTEGSKVKHRDGMLAWVLGKINCFLVVPAETPSATTDCSATAGMARSVRWCLSCYCPYLMIVRKGRCTELVFEMEPYSLLTIRRAKACP
jgi:hypothetical protein